MNRSLKKFSTPENYIRSVTLKCLRSCYPYSFKSEEDFKNDVENAIDFYHKDGLFCALYELENKPSEKLNENIKFFEGINNICLLYTSPSPRDS